MYNYIVYLLSAVIVIVPFLFRKQRKKTRKNIIKITTIVSAIFILAFSILNTIETNGDNKTSKRKIDSLIVTNESLNDKIDTLNFKLTPFIEIAKGQFPELNPDSALSALENEIKNIDRKITGEINDIKTFDASIEVYFTCQSQLKPDEVTISTSNNGLTHLNLIDEKDFVSYLNSNDYSIIMSNDSVALFNTSVKAVSGSPIFDLGIDRLHQIKFMQINIPFTSFTNEEIKFKYVIIKKIIVNFFVNGSILKTIEESPENSYNVSLNKQKDGDFWGTITYTYPFGFKK
nr:hypothetical protein [uncultured Draconibacterium sp.]